MSSDYKHAVKLVHDHIMPTLSDEDKTLIRLAYWDLWYGPFTDEIEGEPYPGWEKAAERLAEIRDAFPSTLYVDTDCGYVGETEPEGYWIEGEANDEDGEEDIPREWVEPEPYWTFDRADIARAVLGKDIVAHI